MLNTRHVQELIERGEVLAVKEAMEQSLAPGSQTFEQDLFRLYREGVITLDEALANADSPTNLSWLIKTRKSPPVRRTKHCASNRLSIFRKPTTTERPSRSSR